MKNFTIIGGGISGLSLLHFLRQRFCYDESLNIQLLEKKPELGGTIRSQINSGIIFENGPNGFLNVKETTLKLIKDLGLDDELMFAKSEAKIRYITENETLKQLPNNPMAFLQSPLIPFGERVKVLTEPFRGKKEVPNETVYDFGVRRFGKDVANKFLDPFVSGIFAGNPKELILKEAFPNFYEMEQRHGSIIKGMMNKKKSQKRGRFDALQLTRELTSFTGGMERIIQKLTSQYKSDIKANQEVISITKKDGQYLIKTNQQTFTSDYLYLSAPAYQSAKFLTKDFPNLSDALAKIEYAPVVVIGFLLSKDIFSEEIKGFGYLNPSIENKKVLGTLFESNIFPERYPENQFFARVMMGGVNHPEIMKLDDKELFKMAFQEVKNVLKLKDESKPQQLFIRRWNQAIPQYNQIYVQQKDIIQKELHHHSGLNLAANFWNGISFNDCINNSYNLAQDAKVH